MTPPAPLLSVLGDNTICESESVDNADMALLERLMGTAFLSRVKVLQAEVERLKAENATLRNERDLAYLDPLTSLPNRRFFETQLERETARSARSGAPLSVVVVDLDGLKQINDRQGHLAGDRAICNLGDFLRRSVRHSDYVFRIGGDEFVILMPDVDAQKARHAMERIQAVRDEERARSNNPEEPIVSFSFGVSDQKSANGLNRDDLINVADADMYERKAARKSIRRGPTEVLVGGRAAA